jgi:SAM-dependent methyltransferase
VNEPIRPADDTVTSERGSLGRAGFETGSDVYERSRPGYPEQAVAHLVERTGIVRGSRVLDLAAGTGKLTRQLSALGSSPLAVEPSASMRAVFVDAVPGVPVAAGTAEAIPVATGTFDAVVAAQSFHWFDPSRALPEIARVLRPGGWLALVWNERDESDPMVAELVRISKWDRCQPYPVGMDFGPVLDRSGLFGPVERTVVPFSQQLDRGAFVDQIASRSYVRVLAPTEQDALLAEVASFAATLEEPITMPYLTDLFCAPVRS